MARARQHPGLRSGPTRPGDRRIRTGGAGVELPLASGSPPAVIEVITREHDTAPGYIFIAPKNGPREAGPGQDGCMILDNDGQPVWLRLLQNEDMDVMNFKVQTYKGETVLTWWEGLHTGYGQGEYVICDHSYCEIAHLRLPTATRGTTTSSSSRPRIRR